MAKVAASPRGRQSNPKVTLGMLKKCICQSNRALLNFVVLCFVTKKFEVDLQKYIKYNRVKIDPRANNAGTEQKGGNCLFQLTRLR